MPVRSAAFSGTPRALPDLKHAVDAQFACMKACKADKGALRRPLPQAELTIVDGNTPQRAPDIVPPAARHSPINRLAKSIHAALWPGKPGRRSAQPLTAVPPLAVPPASDTAYAAALLRVKQRASARTAAAVQTVPSQAVDEGSSTSSAVGESPTATPAPISALTPALARQEAAAEDSRRWSSAAPPRLESTSGIVPSCEDSLREVDSSPAISSGLKSCCNDSPEESQSPRGLKRLTGNSQPLIRPPSKAAGAAIERGASTNLKPPLVLRSSNEHGIPERMWGSHFKITPPL